MGRASSDGVVVIPDFGKGWVVEEHTAREPVAVSMQKCKRFSPDNDYFLFMLAKQYEVAAGPDLSAEEVTNRIFRGTYEKTFETVHYGSTEWVEDEKGVRWFEAKIALEHTKLGAITKIERVHVIGPKVFLVSAEGRQADVRAHHSFVQRWLKECEFPQLAADLAAAQAAATALPKPPSPEELRAGLESELEALFAESAELYEQGRFREAKEVVSDAQIRARRQLGDAHYLTFVGFAQCGELSRALGDATHAASMLEHAIALRTKPWMIDDPELIGPIRNLGRARLDQRDLVRAEQHFVDALERARRLAPASPEVALGLATVGRVRALRGDAAAGEAFLRDALAMQAPPVLSPDHRDALRSMHDLGCVVLGAGRIAEAESLLLRALETRRAMLGPEHPDTIESLASLATIHMFQQQPQRARSVCEQALAATRRVHGDDHLLVADRLLDSVHIGNALGAAAAGLPALTEAHAIRRRRLGPRDPRTMEAAQELAALRRSLGWPESKVEPDGPVSLVLGPDHVIVYTTGNSQSPADPWGAIRLTLHADGRARLENDGRAGARAWDGRVEIAKLEGLLNGLAAAGFPAVREHLIPAGSSLRVITVEAEGREGETFPIAYHVPAEVGYGPVFAVLDGLVVSLSGGAVR